MNVLNKPIITEKMTELGEKLGEEHDAELLQDFLQQQLMAWPAYNNDIEMLLSSNQAYLQRLRQMITELKIKVDSQI